MTREPAERASAFKMQSLDSLLAVLPVGPAAKQRLCALMTHPSRHYHGIDHLVLLWDRHRRFAPAAKLDDPVSNRLVGSAIAYHDAIFEGDRSDNERRSADLWFRESGSGPMGEAEREWVADAILATADHLNYRPDIAVADDGLAAPLRACLWMLDLDLTPLGETMEDFDVNTARLRAERPGMPEAVLEAAQRAFLQRIAAMPRIYRSPVLATAFEGPARRNLARRLAQVGGAAASTSLDA